MFPEIKAHCDSLVEQFDKIGEERKQILVRISDFVRKKRADGLPVNLVYVCTHNSRRSHFGQVWAAVAAAYYGVTGVNTFSGGTEATAFNSNAIEALRSTGFRIKKHGENPNPQYEVSFGEHQSVTCFSKVYDDATNPNGGFAAVMTCSDADENCPFIPGVELRIATTYDDPKAFDGTPQQTEKYLERSNQIALECLYVFSLI